ncbi:MAG: mechanosensitive ion channel family protein [Chloroflexota bacterium]
MGHWFTINSVWILMVATFVLVLLLFVRERLQGKIEGLVPKKWQTKLHGGLTAIFRIIEAAAFGLMALALVAIVLSTEGALAIVTPETIQTWFLQHGTRILTTVVVSVALWLMVKRFLPPLLSRALVRAKGESREGIRKRTDTLLAVLLGVGRISIIIIASFMVLSELDVPIAPILAGFGIAGIAVGFGAQYLIRDLIAGIFIILENQYRVGDVAKVGGISGLVEQVNLRKTVLRDLDGIVHHIPNGEISVASNYTRHFSRVNLNISVSYGTDLDHAIAVINRVCQEMAQEERWASVIKTVPQVLRVDNLGDSGIDLKILGDVKPLEQWNVTGELRLRLKKAFDTEGIEIPWPHTKVYFGNAPGD